MRQKEFENRYQQTWDAFAQKLDQVESIKRRKSVLNNDLKRYDEDYRTLCYCLSLARERQYSPYLIKRLEKLVFRGHQVFYQRKIGIFYQIYRFILFGFPAAVRKQSKFIWIATGIFYLPALIIFALVLLFPELVYSIVEPGQVAEIESMYDPGLDKIGRGRDRASDTDFAMFGHYVWNNIGIAFREFAGGFMATLGTLFYLIFNALFFGALSAHMINAGFEQPFFTFVSGHAPYELTGIVLAGAAGIKLGWAIISPGNFSRKQALINVGRECMVLVYGAIFLLLIAAFVEAFWSSNASIAPIIKYSVGIAGWLLVIVYLTLMGRGRIGESE